MHDGVCEKAAICLHVLVRDQCVRRLLLVEQCKLVAGCLCFLAYRTPPLLGYWPESILRSTQLPDP